MNNIRDMTIMEINVLNAIRNSASYDLPIQASELRTHFGLSKRTLEEIIENLRVTYRHPIVAKKKRPSGYYLPRTEDERNDGLAPYRRQILTEQKNLSAVMSVNLDDYWKEAKKPDGNQAQNK
ncbi:TPA: hypothetical protein VM020_001235 [Streptococcus pyogenes]|nr:hypothetical protein [Streptococcus pyogenes]